MKKKIYFDVCSLCCLLKMQVADLSSMSAETHKFESHYIKNLVGKKKIYDQKYRKLFFLSR